eukprot:25422_1
MLLSYGSRTTIICNDPIVNRTYKSGVCGGKFAFHEVLERKNGTAGPHWWKQKQLMQKLLVGPAPELKHDATFEESGNLLVEYFRKNSEHSKYFPALKFTRAASQSAAQKLLVGSTMDPSDPHFSYMENFYMRAFQKRTLLFGLLHSFKSFSE